MSDRAVIFIQLPGGQHFDYRLHLQEPETQQTLTPRYPSGQILYCNVCPSIYSFTIAIKDIQSPCGYLPALKPFEMVVALPLMIASYASCLSAILYSYSLRQPVIVNQSKAPLTTNSLRQGELFSPGDFH